MVAGIYERMGLQHVNKLERKFLMAARRGDFKTVQQCVRDGVDIDVTNNRGLTALMLAVGPRGFSHGLGLMIADAFNSQARKKSDQNYQKIVQLLLEEGADFTKTSEHSNPGSIITE